MMKTARGFVVLMLLAGCSMVLTEASKPEVRYVITPLSPTDTYARAQRAATKMGAVMMREDVSHAHLRGEVQGSHRAARACE